ncbi:MAG: glycosyltransferase family 4 protein, partial [Coriobacteriia bacterium]|nr:glycosyltransferase family 4 protein [Coriobacteriia bacterium]
MPAKVKVVFVNNFARGLGGGEQQLLCVIEGLLKRECAVSVVAAAQSEFAQAARALGADTVECDLAPTQVVTALRALTTATEGADILVGSGFWTNCLVGMARTGPQVTKIALHQSMPAASSSTAARIARKLLARRVQKSITGHIAVSRALKAELVSQGVCPDLVEVIYNGVALPQGQVTSLPGHSRAPVLGFLGRLEKVKGCDTFLRVVEKVQAQLPEVSAHIAGIGSQRRHLQKMARDLGIDGRVKFLGQQETYEFLSKVDLLLIPSRAEAFSLVAVEAQRAQRPVLAFAVGGLPEVLLSDTTTRLIAAGDITALAAETIALLEKLPQLSCDLEETAQRALAAFLPQQSAE